MMHEAWGLSATGCPALGWKGPYGLVGEHPYDQPQRAMK